MNEYLIHLFEFLYKVKNNINMKILFRIPVEKPKIMRPPSTIYYGLSLVLLSLFVSINGSYHDNPDTNTCDSTVNSQCGRSGSSWNGGSACSSIYGGFNGNQHNLNLMMRNQLTDSFKLLLMVT